MKYNTTVINHLLARLNIIDAMIGIIKRDKKTSISVRILVFGAGEDGKPEEWVIESLGRDKDIMKDDLGVEQLRIAKELKELGVELNDR